MKFLELYIANLISDASLLKKQKYVWNIKKYDYIAKILIKNIVSIIKLSFYKLFYRVNFLNISFAIIFSCTEYCKTQTFSKNVFR